MNLIPAQPFLEPVEGNRSGPGLLQVLWNRKSLVILGLVIGLILGSLYYVQRPRVYQTTAKILVVKKSGEGLAGSSSVMTGFNDEYMSNQAVILGSQNLAERTASSKDIRDLMDRGQLKSFPDAKKPEDIVLGIMTNLSITRDNRDTERTSNNVLVLNFRGPNSDESQTFIENHIKCYQEYLDTTYKSKNMKMLDDLNAARKELEDKITGAEREYMQFVTADSPILLTKQNGGMSIYAKLYDTMMNEYTLNEIQLRKKKTELDSIEKLMKDPSMTPAKVIQWILSTGGKLNPTGDDEMDKALRALKLDEQQLLSKFGANHPDVIAIRKRMDSIRDIFKQLSDDPKNTKTIKSGERELNPAEHYIEVLKISVKNLEHIHAILDREVEKLRTQVQQQRTYEVKDESLKQQIARAKKIQDQVVNRLDGLDLERERGGYEASILSRPSFGKQVAPMPFQVFTASALLGLMFGCGLAYLAEVSDKSFRNPAEIRRRLGLPVIGHVPFLAADEKATQLVSAGSSTLDPMLITHYQSNSTGAEAYRGVRTALYFSTHGAANQVIQVTSPNVSDGKSTLAANLAVCIAQSGKRTLIIDADFRKPRVHKIFNVPATCGMASVMVGQADFHQAIQQSAIPNLSVLPCGPRPLNPSELLSTQKFKDLLDQLRTQFDFVIVDTPPVLVVTDPIAVAPRVDGVVLCIRVTKNGRPYAERAREMLLSHGANILGIVVNGFGSQVGGNKYGYDQQYQYGYGEGYNYTYGYAYADKDAASYYAQHEDAAGAAKS